MIRHNHRGIFQNCHKIWQYLIRAVFCVAIFNLNENEARPEKHKNGQTINLMSHFHQLKEMSFDEIKKTKYIKPNDEILISVNKSASFLYLPLKKVTTIYGFKVTWSYNQALNLRSSDQEKKKQGDDALLRIGFFVYGPAPSLPFFTPSWIEKIGKNLLHPTNKIIWFLGGSRQKKGTVWTNPYSDEIKQISLGPAQKSSWTTQVHKLAIPIKASAIAFGSDGDNTNSDFKIRVKHLSILSSDEF